MRTNEERIKLINMRTLEIKSQNKRHRQYIIDAICVAACIMLVAFMGVCMPDLIAGLSADGGMSYTSGAASLVGKHEALGYILVGVASFVLGICVTILLYRISHGKRNDR